MLKIRRNTPAQRLIREVPFHIEKAKTAHRKAKANDASFGLPLNALRTCIIAVNRRGVIATASNILDIEVFIYSLSPTSAFTDGAHLVRRTVQCLVRIFILAVHFPEK